MRFHSLGGEAGADVFDDASEKRVFGTEEKNFWPRKGAKNAEKGRWDNGTRRTMK